MKLNFNINHILSEKENLNKIFFIFLRIGMSIVFLLAAIYRIFHPLIIFKEISELKLPLFVGYLVIAVELIMGFSFLSNKFVLQTSIMGIIFLLFAIIYGLIINFNFIIKKLYVIFIFNPEPTDILLHFIYLILLIMILLYSINLRKRKNN